MADHLIWADGERCLDAVTAMSGSGPTYAFLLIETMQKIGQELGLDGEMAGQLVLGTVYGAALLAHNSAAAPVRFASR